MEVCRLTPSFREKIWGSPRLEPWFPNADRKIGEVWFQAEPALPILVKFLYTTENLSVQVHPAGPCGVGKTEMWRVLRADPGARLALGLREPVTAGRFREAARSGAIEELLNWVPVAAGETYFVPAGTVHAIGAGIALCEIQQNSDITYRVYDYGRPRELHLEEALRCATLGPHPGRALPRPAGPGREVLASCEWFETERWQAEVPVTLPPWPRFRLVIFLEGEGCLGNHPYRAGEVCHLPAGAEPITLLPERTTELLVTFVPGLDSAP